MLSTRGCRKLPAELWAGCVLRGLIGEPIKRLAYLIGEPIKLTGKRALRKALGACAAPVEVAAPDKVPAVLQWGLRPRTENLNPKHRP